MVLIIKSTMISCSVAQAKHLSAQGIYVRSARHDQEGAPQVGSQDKKKSGDSNVKDLPTLKPYLPCRWTLHFFRGLKGRGGR